MKCPKCGYDQRAKDGMQCEKCQYQFSFNPKDASTRWFTDGKFEAAIRLASQNNTTYFTRNQLYSACCQKTQTKVGDEIGCAIVGIVLGAILYFGGMWPIVPLIAVVALFKLFKGIFSIGKTMTRDTFEQMLKRWRAEGKKIEKLIERPQLGDKPPEWKEPDIYDYGVERLLIVERELLVDLLVMNDQHAEQKMLVICESGYPHYLQPIANQLLSEQPALPVFLLHDATEHGVGMMSRVNSEGRFSFGKHKIIDLGLFPSDFGKLKRTKRLDQENKARALPVDTLMVPFLAMGLSAAMAEGQTFETIIDEQHKQDASGGGDFG